MYVIGTAGHVDHGKSTLVKALTGIDPDRLQEEKERGMTIDLGFAWLKLPSGREVSIVDVPGHERFIKNMLAGVGGIDLALLVIAADEGVMPQTREHLAILDLLRIQRGAVVVTKRDLVDEDWLELVISDAEEAVKGTVLAGAPFVSVSAISRAGLPELLKTVDDLLGRTNPRADLGRPRLPIDRVFTVAGFGTVVTGTLIDGRLSVGQEVEIQPKGLRTRVRSLQTHKHRVETIGPGTRVAVNLTGLATTDLGRGDVLTTPGWLRPTAALDCRLRATRDLPHPLAHNTPVTFHLGSAEATGRVRLLNCEELKPAETAWAQVKLDEPVSAARGDFFIVRSSNWTLGGGQIVDPHPKRHRRFHASTLAALETMERGAPEDILHQYLEKNQPIEVRLLLQRGGLEPKQAPGALRKLLQEGRAVLLAEGDGANGAAEAGGDLAGSGFVLSGGGWSRLTAQATDLLRAHHKQFPLRAGMPREELKSRLKLSPRAFGDALRRMAATGEIIEEGVVVRMAGHQVRLTPDQQARVEAFLRELARNPYVPPSEAIPEPELVGVLTDQGKVVRLTENVVFEAATYRGMVDQVIARTRAQGKITVAEVRDLFNTSRKYALALMEHLDEAKITRRVGDERVLRE